MFFQITNLPGLVIAGSRTSGTFVAPITMTPEVDPKPSNSARNWFKVDSVELPKGE